MIIPKNHENQILLNRIDVLHSFKPYEAVICLTILILFITNAVILFLSKHNRLFKYMRRRSVANALNIILPIMFGCYVGLTIIMIKISFLSNFGFIDQTIGYSLHIITFFLLIINLYASVEYEHTNSILPK